MSNKKLESRIWDIGLDEINDTIDTATTDYHRKTNGLAFYRQIDEFDCEKEINEKAIVFVRYNFDEEFAVCESGKIYRTSATIETLEETDRNGKKYLAINSKTIFRELIHTFISYDLQDTDKLNDKEIDRIAFAIIEIILNYVNKDGSI